MNETWLSNDFEKMEYDDIKVRVYYKKNTDGRFLVNIYEGRSQKRKNKYNIYSDFFHALEGIKTYINNCRKRNEYKEEQKRIQKQNAEELLNEIKIGSIFVNSWGYDQTNVNAYQVIEKKSKTIKVKRIALKSVEGTQGFMSESVIPVPDSFFSTEVISKRVTGSYINGIGSLWDGESDYYNSWYA